MITNRDTGDESTYEQCDVMIATWADWKQCRRPKGHAGVHTPWYFHPEGGWGRKTTPRVSNELMKDKDE